LKNRSGAKPSKRSADPKEFGKGELHNMANEKGMDTHAGHMNDATRASPAERERVHFESSLIGRMIEAREERGLSQRKLAEISGVKQPAIARLESMKTTPRIDTLLKVLHPLGYTIEIVPLPMAKQ
jgi:DNA-binding XRE family transcriptional regulator